MAEADAQDMAEHEKLEAAATCAAPLAFATGHFVKPHSTLFSERFRFGAA